MPSLQKVLPARPPGNDSAAFIRAATRATRRSAAPAAMNMRVTRSEAAEVLTLTFHQLATNALKYGAISAPAGGLRVSWSTFKKHDRTWLTLSWIEMEAPSRGPTTRRDFGTDLLEGRIPYELSGTGKVVIGAGGAHFRLEFPSKDGEASWRPMRQPHPWC